MDKFSVNDWLTIQTRKDISLIRRGLKNEPIKYGIIIDLFLVILSTCLDNTYNGENTVPAGWWIGIVAVATLITIGSLGFSIWRECRRKTDRLMALSVSELIDLFDNEVCYNIMTADSMDDHLILDNNGSIKANDEVQKFYFIEACYYLDKAITQLDHFGKNSKMAIYTGKGGYGVSLIRFENVCTLIADNYNHLIKISSNIDVSVKSAGDLT